MVLLRRVASLLLVGFLLAAVGSSAPVSTRGGPLSCRVAWARTASADQVFDFSEAYQHYRQRLPRQGCRKNWTVLVYMAADYQGLPEVAYQDLAEMEAPFADPSVSAASTVDADVVVELDVRQPEGVRRLHMFRAPGPVPPSPPSGSGDVRSPVVEWLPREDTAPAESLRAFVAWGVASYPAQRYLVIVWGHGLGWRPAQPGTEPVWWTAGGRGGGIAFDQSQGSVLDTPSLHHALQAAGRPLDVYVSHACLMQSMEVASELAPAARYLVGSEQVLGFVGLPYRSILPRVNGTLALPWAAECAGPDAACRVAHLLPEVQHEAFPAGPGDAATFTLSALDSRVFTQEVLTATRRLSAAILAWLDEDPLNKIDLREVLATPDTGSHGGGSPGFRGAYRDFGVFLTNLSRVLQLSDTPAGTALRDTVAQTRQVLERAVISADFGTEYDTPAYDGKLGVSSWLPHDADEYHARAAFFASAPFFRAGAADWLPQVFAPAS